VRIEVCTTIEVTPEVLWQFLEPIERHVDWMSDAEAIIFTSEQQRGVGTTFDCRTRIGPLRTTDTMEVTEWDPASAMGILHRGAVTGEGRFTLRERPGGATWFCWAETLRFPWFLGGRAGELAARPLLRALWRRNLVRLRSLAEGPRRETP
jgi:hypothetical protein